MKSTIVPVGAARIAAEWAGEGQTVVFLHAGVADRRMWHGQIAALASSYHTIAIDRRGFGETAAADETYSQTSDLFAVLDRLVDHGKPVVLVGCSQGSSIAIDAALASPDRVAALILISPSVSGAPATAPHDAVRCLLDAINLAKASGDRHRVNQLQAALWLDGPLVPEGRVMGEARDMFLAMNEIALSAPAIGRVIQPDPAWDRLHEIALSVRILCGDLDVPHIQMRCHQLQKHYRTPSLRCLDGAAHLPSLEQPDRVARCLLTWFSEIETA